MDERNKDFQERCDAVITGAGDAETHFREAVVPHLRTIVRRSLRRKQGRPTFDARRLDGGSAATHSRGTMARDEARIDRTARRLCETLIDALPSPSGRPRKDTTVEAFPHRTIVPGPVMGGQVG